MTDKRNIVTSVSVLFVDIVSKSSVKKGDANLGIHNDISLSKICIIYFVLYVRRLSKINMFFKKIVDCLLYKHILSLATKGLQVIHRLVKNRDFSLDRICTFVHI